MSVSLNRHKTRVGKQRKAAVKALQDAILVAKHCRTEQDKADMWDRLIAAGERIFEEAGA